MTTLAFALLALAVPAPAPAAEPAPATAETRVSVDFKDADVLDVVRLLADLGNFQVVAHPGITCKLTLKLKEVPLQTALDLALKTCGLGSEEQSGVVRIATTATLTAEHAAQRKLDEERRLSGPLTTKVYRLSYARAADLAPLVKKMLSPRGDVIFDARTNTLIVTDIED